MFYCDNDVSGLCENYGLRGSNDIHNTLYAAVVKMQVVIDLRDDRPFCLVVENSERPLRHFEQNKADGRPL